MTPPTPRSHIPDTGNMVHESKMPEPVACQHIQDCTTPKLCLSVGTCKGYYVMPASVRESASKMPEPVFIFWSADGEHIRLWTKDRFRALRFATDSGAEAKVYVQAENVTAAWQEATRQAMERTLSICRQMEERGYDAKDCAEAIEDAMRALLPPTSPTSEESGNG